MAGRARLPGAGHGSLVLRELTTAMGHADMLDAESLTRELLAGAHAWRIGDWPGSVNRLRAAFEVLTQVRERFYPVDAYVIDLCLLDPSMGEGVLADPLATPVAISFLAQAGAIETSRVTRSAADGGASQAIADGWADVVGGTYAESRGSAPALGIDPLAVPPRAPGRTGPLLEDRSAETYARRRFGLYAQLPQIAKRFGFRYAVHLGFDAGRFPIPSETKRLWESPDGSSLESLMRPPLAADRPAQGWSLPWRLAATMKNDHVAALPLAHWPRPVAPWYLDLRRVATYSPVLGRWTTLNDFFHLSDRPYETFRPESDQYVTPYLQQAVAKRESQPVTRLTRHHRLRARLDAAWTFQALAQAIAAASQAAAEPAATDASVSNPLDELETLIESGRHAEVEEGLDEAIAMEAEALTNRLVTVAADSGSGDPSPSIPKRPGYLVLNPIGLSPGRGSPPRCGARSATGRAAARRPVHRRRGSRCRSTCRHSASRGCRASPIPEIRRSPKRASRRGDIRSATSSWRSRSTRPPAASGGWRPSGNRARG